MSSIHAATSELTTALWRAVAVMALLALIVGCGQKGPLYLPAEDPPVETPDEPLPSPSDES